MKAIILCLFALAFSGLIAQNPDNINYTWDKEPVFANTDSLNSQFEAILLKDKIIYNYFFNPQTGDLEELMIYHRAYRVCRDKAIEQLNTVEINMDNIVELVDIKARVFTADGKVLEVNKNDIKNVEDEAEGGNYKALALPGVEKDAIIEYYYIAYVHPNILKSLAFQSSIPRYNNDFFLECPSTLGFVTKSYNGFPNIEEEFDTAAHRRIYAAHADYVPALPIQKYGEDSPHEQTLLVSIGYNYNRNKARMFTHAEFCSNYYPRMYELDKKEQKALSKIVKEAKSKSKDRFTAAIETENYLKTHYFKQNISSDRFENLDFIKTSAMGSETGILKLYLNVFKAMGYECQLLYTCGRDFMFFDKDFNAYNLLEEPIIYFPELKSYMSPTRFTSRLGWPYDYTLEQNALWMKEISIAGAGSFMPAYTTISSVDYKNSGDSLFQQLVINEDADKATLKTRRVLTGYKAMPIHPFYPFYEAEKQQEFLEAYLDFGHAYFDMDSANVENDEIEDILIKPFVINASLIAGNTIEPSGDHILVLIGDLIGAQAEMYDSVPRTLPVDHGYPSHYYRKLSITIPSGYIVDNAEDFKIDVNLNNSDGNAVAWFKSDFSTEDNQFIVVIEECYTKIQYPVSEYEGFRKVVNAAADFSKMKLVLAKQ
ncbi:MAG: hypothetical protein CVU11_01445 [Bacteroidetes bacterium HGW-Bacteroidetes-6]|jgi:hypothetical protein|nr:MAG: hypothetical protein CVU11_01445 [Bacteroidetes bacterium HGW-Bacteroidetes-6]